MVRRVGWFGLVALLVTVASILACRQTIGIDQYFNAPADAGAGTSACGLPYGTSTCASCVQASCCGESNACATSPACNPYETCLGKCSGDPKCRSQCTIDHPVGTSSDVLALSACLAGKCETACGLTCGGVANLLSEPDAAAACQACVASAACSQAEACGSSEPCNGYLWANLSFSTLDSTQAYEQALCASSAASGLVFQIDNTLLVCGTSPPTIAPDGGYSTSFQQACRTPCALGTSWECVGQVSWPAPKAPTATIDYQVKDFVTGAPVAEALVQVCSPTDPKCTQPLTQGTTLANGRISLTFDNRVDFNGLGLNGFLRVTSPNIVPFDYYWAFPLVEAQYPILFAEVVTPTELQDQWNALGVTSDPTRGTLVVYAQDCRYFGAAPGVKITLSTADALTQGFSTTGLATTTTDQAGLIVFANVPAGDTQITETPLALAKPVSQVVVAVQAGAMTDVYMRPTPTP